MPQGDVYTPIEAGEGSFVPVGVVHGTVNDTGSPARLISFQSPPDLALYAGKRNPRAPAHLRCHPTAIAAGCASSHLAKGGPAIGQPGDWR